MFSPVSTRSCPKIFVAGASGAIGRVLVRLLIEDGWHVCGTTRFAERADELASLGAEPFVVDVLDAGALHRVADHARPDALVQQLTDLPRVFDRAAMPEALARNARLRVEGTRNLIDAFGSTPVRTLVIQSGAFAYAPGVPPYAEEHPLDVRASDSNAALTAGAIATMERLALASPYDTRVLRYGRFYGPGTWTNAPPKGCAVHVHAAADAARRALSMGQAGIYNIAEPGGNVAVEKAFFQLNWSPGFRAANAS